VTASSAIESTALDPSAPEPSMWQDTLAMAVHAFLLSWLMLRFILRYAWVIFRERVLERPIAAAKLVALNEKTAREYVRVAMKLKGGMIKMGQFVSARADVVPKELVAILKELQDRVQPAPFHEVQQTIEAQFGKPLHEVFASIEPQALAAASFGQAHRARTKEGKHVVIKVLHREIERSLRVDLAIFRVAVFFFGRLFPKFMVDRIYDEIASVTLAELDYLREADSAERVKEILKNDKRVRVPYVLREYTRPRVLCLEDITGLRIDDPKLIEAHGGSPREVMKAVVGAFCEQIYVHGFFQSDPHAGNLFFYPPDPNNPEAPIIGIIDFGQAKEIPPRFHEALRRAVLSTMQKDADMFLAAIVEMGIVEEVEIEKVRAVVTKLGAQIKDGSVREVMALDYESLARDVMKALQDLEAFSIPNDLVLYGRTLGILHGLNFLLDPELPIFEIAGPYLMKFAFGR
jgi:predicted unusual protein kinase regulating ubiquinone biosynthesis (AarF/ABC1/UbiB family)